MSRSFICEDLRLNISRELNEITVLISSGLASVDGVILRLDSVLETIRSVSKLTFVTWAAQVEHTLEQAIYELQQWGEVISEPRSVGMLTVVHTAPSGTSICCWCSHKGRECARFLTWIDKIWATTFAILSHTENKKKDFALHCNGPCGNLKYTRLKIKVITVYRLPH